MKAASTDVTRGAEYHPARRGDGAEIVTLDLALALRIDAVLGRPATAPHLKQLDRRGFIAEVGRSGDAVADPRSLHRRFWFEDEGGTVGDVFRPGVDAVALHTSWTPDWYRELSREEVLANGCLRSRSLAHLLSR